jgi:hypothetical protein
MFRLSAAYVIFANAGGNARPDQWCDGSFPSNVAVIMGITMFKKGAK